MGRGEGNKTLIQLKYPLLGGRWSIPIIGVGSRSSLFSYWQLPYVWRGRTQGVWVAAAAIALLTEEGRVIPQWVTFEIESPTRQEVEVESICVGSGGTDCQNLSIGFISRPPGVGLWFCIFTPSPPSLFWQFSLHYEVQYLRTFVTT